MFFGPKFFLDQQLFFLKFFFDLNSLGPDFLDLLGARTTARATTAQADNCPGNNCPGRQLPR